MVRVNTTLASLCVVLVLGAACTGPTPPEPAPEAPRSLHQALGEGPASSVGDLATTANTALVRFPSSLSVSGSTLLFSAGDETLGPELWRLTASGPALVDDIIPGPMGSSPSNLFSMQGLTWFSATDGQHGLELWRTDGTPSGTALLADIRPGADSSRPSGFAGFNGWIFFRADDGTHGVELWRTDGTTEGTQLVRDILLGSGDSNPQSFTELGGALYFLANGPGGVRQLWSTDGSAKGTNAITSRVTVSDAPPVRGLVKLGRTLFFAGSDGSSGTELWKSDGTDTGTVRVKDIAPGSGSSSPTQLTVLGGSVYFVATDGTTGRELWKSDGTEAGTMRVADLVSGNNTVEGPDSLVAASTRLFFLMRDSASVPSALYVTDGTAAGTLKLVDFKALGGRGPLQMLAHGGTLYFSGYEPSVAYEVWTSDGTSAGTQRLGGSAGLIPGRAGDPAPSEFTEQGDTVYFVANAPGTGLSDDYPPIPTLWKTQGSTATTKVVGAELQPTVGSNPAPFASWNGALYFTTFEQDAAARLWRSDGTAAGTLSLATIVPSSAPRFEAPLGLSALTPSGDALYFTVFDPSTATFPLWKTKGTAATTGLVSSSVTLSTSTSFPIELATHAGALFFAGQDSSHGFELWTSDGTDAGTSLVKDIVSGSGSSSPSSFTDTAGALYFLAKQPTGRELWKTDGSAAGTVRVADIRDSLGNSGIISIAGVMGGSLYFVANQAGTGSELWKTDGTTTTQVKDIAPGAQDSSPSHFAVLGATLYFTANDGSSGTELWKTDGTAAGTSLVRDILPGSQGSSPTALTGIDSTLYFTANDGTSGSELWRSDGTAAGTSLVKDILPGSAGGVLAESLFALSTEKLLLFAANDGVSGNELWRSDGTAAGTFLLHDLAPLQLGSDPAGFTLFGGNIVFSANDGLHGREPWIMARALLTNSTPPHITCPANQKVEAQQALGAQVAFPDATATDDTSIPPALVYSRSQGSFFPFGVTSVTALARDAAGLTDSCVFTVEVRDTTQPDVVCPVNVTAEAMDATGATVSYSAPYATDTVTRGITPTASPASGTRFPQGNTTVTVTARDAAGNQGQCTFTVRVQDTTAAVLTCPADQVVEAEDATGALATWPAPTATDPVSTPTVTSKPTMGSRFSLGTTPVVVTATDAAGNTSSCTFRVSVRDTHAPTLSCPAPVQVEALGPTGAPADFVVTNYTDTVSAVTVSTDPASGSTFPVGITSVRVQARDLSGNTTECTFPVRVVDTLPPLLTCPQDVNVSKGPAAVTLPQPSAKDRVTLSPSVSMDPASGSVFPVGDTPVTVTARDDAGNSAQCTFTVHVDKARGGCSSAPGSADALTWLGMLCLLVLATRRRALSSPRDS